MSLGSKSPVYISAQLVLYKNQHPCLPNGVPFFDTFRHVHMPDSRKFGGHFFYLFTLIPSGGRTVRHVVNVQSFGVCHFGQLSSQVSSIHMSRG